MPYIIILIIQTKLLFSDLYLAQFLDAAKSFFPCTIVQILNEIKTTLFLILTELFYRTK